jgi:hypothetical protein
MKTCFFCHWLIYSPSPPHDLGPDAESVVQDEPVAEEWNSVSPIIDLLLPLSSPQIWDLVQSPEFEMSWLLKNDDLFLPSLIDYSPSPPRDLGPGAEPGVWDEPAAEGWRPVSPIIDWLFPLSSPRSGTLFGAGVWDEPADEE